MRLLDTTTFKLKEFLDDPGAEYVILSHRWEEDEISLQQLVSGQVRGDELGFLKIQKCCEEAAREGFQYVWIDTCCIDKTSSAELSEAINSMYRWYQKAARCYAYLSDVEIIDELAESLWFTRGWTLQELVVSFLVSRICLLINYVYPGTEAYNLLQSQLGNHRWEKRWGKRFWAIFGH